MKRSIITLSLLWLMQSMLLGQAKEGRFLLSDSPVKLTTFYAEINPGTSFSSMNDQTVNISELSAGLILNNKFYLAFFMTGSPKINTVSIPDPGTEKYDNWEEAGVEMDQISRDAEFLYVKFRHTGLRAGYMHNTHKTLFWRTGLQFGFSGGLNMTEDQTFLGVFDNLVFETSIMTLEPQFGLGLNLLYWWRLHLDAGYRIMNVDTRILSSTNTDSFTFKLGFAFGNFRQK